jgi:hypothetical protein
MNWRTQQNEQESESQLLPKLAHPDLRIPNPFLGRAPIGREPPNPFLGLRPIERENRAAAGTTKIILRPVKRRRPASPLAGKCSDQIEFNFQYGSSSSQLFRGAFGKAVAGERRHAPVP